MKISTPMFTRDKSKQRSIGGVSIIAIGDMYQLQPVKENIQTCNHGFET